MYKKRYLLTTVLIWLSLTSWGQLSQGGKPMDIPVSLSLKSKADVALPTVDNQKLLKTSLTQWNTNHLKPFRFAVPISVSLNTENSGRWTEVGRYRVWQLVIFSAHAKSLNLIFDHYHLPLGARLFLFSADKSDVIGAFTSRNNKASEKFATSPVIGDRLVVQYEEPLNAAFDGELSISQVNHDFVGVKSTDQDRRPLGVSGSCNMNVNCDVVNQYKNESNAICRIIVSGVDLCTGALVNNTNEDGTPYIYTAGHCINTNLKANESIFLFNYESPYCGDIDGDASHSISGSALRAASDSLDFSLVQLSETPPATYRPYYLGWERGSGVPDSSVCIHHPLGDIKKIAIDRHSPKIKTYSVDYMQNDFFLIGNWEVGTTEGGSSGAPLINQNKHLVGSLTGGAATCDLPVDDYFERFHNAWNHYTQSSMQLKKWLDPKGANPQSLNGFNPYAGANACGAYTNFRDDDEYANLDIKDQGSFSGYWSGNNQAGFTEFAERFDNTKSAEIAGVSIGVGKVSRGRVNTTGKVEVMVYQGANKPDSLLYTQDFDLQSFEGGVMNYLAFDQKVKTKGTFFIAYSLKLLEPTDTFSVFLAKRQVEPFNTYFIKDGGNWYSYPEKTNGQEGSSLLMEVVMCNIDALDKDTTLKSTNLDFEVFPNPLHAGQKLLMKFKKPVAPYIVQVFDIMGRRTDVTYEQLSDRWLSLDFSRQIPGNYFIKVVEPKKRYHARVMYLGN
ncbi:MAG TPA: T9SS type A sorting domain-containing protein [Sunxiuqinia sp.]|nr:T9SS type A sorting domain-containing protein [Sunxiuqinia sp.]